MSDFRKNICDTALRLIELLSECEDESFVETIGSAVLNNDSGAIMNLQDDE